MEEFWKLLVIALSCFRLSAALKNTRYYPRYHLAPVKGWMNDPNGFCVFKGEYHLFYQYNPESSLVPGTARWGHAKSKDLFHWVNQGIALQNDKPYDKNGVFSGSAIIDSGIMYLFYTGHVNLPGQTPHQNETQALAMSKDGIHFKKYENNPVILGQKFQPNIRDPKVWKHGDYFYMVLGTSFQNENDVTLGRIVLFKSSDKINWEFASTLAESDGFLGYMYECPDFFEIDGVFVLLFSPQGVKPEGDKYKNLYQTGYLVGDFCYETNTFTPFTEFVELDSGHDFYATQTILDKSNRNRLLVAWMDMWETGYPEAKDGFTGQMTLIRTLTLTKNYKLLQKPVKEVVLARGKTLFSGKAQGGRTVCLSNKAGEVYVKASSAKDFTLNIGTETCSVEIKYEYKEGCVSLKRDDSDNGLRRATYRPTKDLILRIFIDASSIEVFCGEGEVTFSSRYFIDGPISVCLGEESSAKLFTVHEMKTTLYTN